MTSENQERKDYNEIEDRQNNVTDEDLWPSRTCAIVGDSMLNGIDDKRLSKKYGNVKVFPFSGARIEDINHYITPIIKKKPDFLILHVGTNDATTDTSRTIADNLLMLKSNIAKQLPSCKIIISKPTYRNDDGKANLTMRNVNKHLGALELDCIENENINAQHLGQKGLHLNAKGKGRLALNFLRQIRKF